MKVKSLSRVRLFATPWTAAHQAPLSVGFSRQEYEWGAIASGYMKESYRAQNSLQLKLLLGFPCGSSGKESTCNAGDLSSIPGLRRSPGKGKGYPVKTPHHSFSLFSSVAQSCLTASSWTTAHQASLSITNLQSLLKLMSTESVISSSVVSFSCPQSFPASGSFQMSQLFASGGQSIGVSASASVLPMNTQD